MKTNNAKKESGMDNLSAVYIDTSELQLR